MAELNQQQINQEQAEQPKKSPRGGMFWVIFSMLIVLILANLEAILKPIKADDLQRALDKFNRLSSSEKSTYHERVETMIESSRQEYQRVFLVHFKDKIIPLNIDDVAYFYTFSERVTLTTLDGATYPVDKTLETLGNQLASDKFFRANRQFIVSRKAVKDIVVWFGSRLALNLTIETPERIIISKARVPEFKRWLQ